MRFKKLDLVEILLSSSVILRTPDGFEASSYRWLDDLTDAAVELPLDFPQSIPRPESGAIEETSASLPPGSGVPEDWVTYVVPRAQLASVVEAYRRRLDEAGFAVSSTNDRFGPTADQVELQLDHVPPARVVFAQTGAAVSVAVLVSRV